jgi:hypothetical protein
MHKHISCKYYVKDKIARIIGGMHRGLPWLLAGEEPTTVSSVDKSAVVPASSSWTLASTQNDKIIEIVNATV